MNTIVAPMAELAVATATFVQSIGINTHIDFSWTPYADLTEVQTALTYLDVGNIRDAIDNPSDLAKFVALNQDLGVKFDFFIAPGDAGMSWQLQQIESDPSIVRFVEGANESDNWPQTDNGLSGLAATIAEQRALYAGARNELPGVPVIAPSFGDLASYAATGDLSAYANLANAHIYFGSGNNPGDQNWIQTVSQTVSLSAPNEPMVTTETGYYTSTDASDPNAVDPTTQAKYLLDDVLDQFNAGVTMDYLYELVDEGTDPTNPQDNFGLFGNDWTAKPAAIAIHDLMLLMQSGATASPVPPGTLSYSLSGMPATANSLLFEKSDGTFVLAVWNDVRLTGPVANADVVVPSVPVTLTLGSPAALIDVFDPLTGTNTIQSAENVTRMTLGLLDHPILIEIGRNAGPPTAPPVSGPAPAAIPAAPTGLTLSVPASEIADPLQTITIAGVTIADPWAAGLDGTMTLNLSAVSGNLTLTDAGGNAVPGSGDGSLSLDANLFQINTDLAHLTYTAATGNDIITVDVWDPSGLEVTRTITVVVGPQTSPAVPAPPPAPAPAGPIITAPPGETVPAGTTIALSSGSVADAFAATNPGTAVLNLTASSGTLTMTDATGAQLPGSGTQSISVSATLAQINADLTRLTYTADGTAGSATIGLDFWDQAGQEVSASVGITVTGSQIPPSPGPAAITIAATDAAPVITASDSTANATAGNHQISVAGTGDTISAVGGKETVMAFLGGNTITTGGKNDTIRIAGSGNIVNAGAGDNEIDDSGTGNTIILPKAGQGTDNIFGYVMQDGDLFDFRASLAGTKWNGDIAAIKNFIRIGYVNGSDVTISIVPSGIAGGAGDVVATLHGSGPVTLPVLLTQAMI